MLEKYCNGLALVCYYKLVGKTGDCNSQSGCVRACASFYILGRARLKLTGKDIGTTSNCLFKQLKEPKGFVLAVRLMLGLGINSRALISCITNYVCVY